MVIIFKLGRWDEGVNGFVPRILTEGLGNALAALAAIRIRRLRKAPSDIRYLSTLSH